MPKKTDTDAFRVPPGKAVDLGEWPTRVKAIHSDDEDYERRLAHDLDQLRDLQQKLYADDRYALLFVFQAMDAAGKDGAIKHVMSGVNPQGCQVFSFKHPSAEDLDHDFLWRSARCLPERGRIGIFNRSYYEEVLIVRVHPEILAAQRLPGTVPDGEVWEQRFASITSFERHLHENGTRIVKFFLHLSKDEQRDRLVARIDDPDKNWKVTPGDVKERKLWKAYMRAYEACLSATSTKHAPWYVVPADDKRNARLIVSRIVVATMKGLDLAYPETPPSRRAELQAIRDQLLAK
jgi:PPK2 family polyphosphate:nucleotide phosphotransferase